MENFQLNSPAEAVLEQIRAIAMANVTDLVGVKDGELTIRSTDELTCSQRAAIASIEKSAGSLKVKFYDKLKALEILAKTMGLFDRPALPKEDGNSLIQVIVESTKEVIDTRDLPEIQQATASCNDLVESPGSETDGRHYL